MASCLERDRAFKSAGRRSCQILLLIRQDRRLIYPEINTIACFWLDCRESENSCTGRCTTILGCGGPRRGERFTPLSSANRLQPRRQWDGCKPSPPKCQGNHSTKFSAKTSSLSRTSPRTGEESMIGEEWDLSQILRRHARLSSFLVS